MDDAEYADHQADCAVIHLVASATHANHGGTTSVTARLHDAYARACILVPGSLGATLPEPFATSAAIGDLLAATLAFVHLMAL